MDEGVRARVTLVFREIEPDASSGYRDEQRKARLELMLPLLAESKPLVPRHGTGCVLDIENWNDLFFHGAQPIQPRATPTRARQDVSTGETILRITQFFLPLGGS